MRGKSPKNVADLILMLAAPGGFEDTLSYVKLPVLDYTPEIIAPSSRLHLSTYGANQSRHRGTDAQEENPLGRSSAVAIFDKLAQVGVRHVLRVVVEEDMRSSPHTDASIERAISGQDSMVSNNRRTEPGIDIEVWYV